MLAAGNALLSSHVYKPLLHIILSMALQKESANTLVVQEARGHRAYNQLSTSAFLEILGLLGGASQQFHAHWLCAIAWVCSKFRNLFSF